MVFNKEDLTLTQLKLERRKCAKKSFFNKIISPSFESGKKGISHIAEIIDNKKVCVGHQINTKNDEVIQPIDTSLLNIETICDNYSVNQSQTTSGHDFQLIHVNHILHKNKSHLIESEVKTEEYLANGSANSPQFISTVDTINESSNCSQNSKCSVSATQKDAILTIGSDNKMIDSNRESLESPNDMTQNDRTAAVEETANNSGHFKTLKGLTLAFISALFFSITTVIVKYVNDVHPGEMAFFRFLGILLFTFPLLMESRQNPFGPPNVRHWLILRGVAGASSLYFRYCALHYMSIADATVIVLSMPVFVCIFARICLKESFGLFHVLALVITFIGIAFTSKLAIIFGSNEDTIKSKGIDASKEIIGLICSLCATLIGSSAYVIVRKIKSVHHSVILFNFSWVAIIETSIITYSLDGFKIPECGMGSWMLSLLAVFSFYGQILLTKALQVEEAGLVSVTRASSEVIFAFIFQITIFSDIPDGWSILGALLVTTSVLLTLSRKWVLTLPIESRMRKALNFVTK